MGAPNAGKGTLAQGLQIHFGIPHLSMGDVFKQLAKENNPEGIRARDEYWGKGNLVPDAKTTQLLRIILAKDDYRNGVILDGYPRTIYQAEQTENIFPNYEVLWLEADRNVLIERARNRRVCESCKRVYNLVSVRPKLEDKCDACSGRLIQREDDLLTEHRLEVYEKQTKPIFDYYKNKLKIIDANKSPREILSQALFYLIK